MKQTFQYGQYTYSYFIEFADRKSFTLIVRPDLRIIVRVPLESSLTEIEVFLQRKWRWLDKQLRELKQYQKKHAEKQFVSGETFYYLGRQYMLEVVRSQNNIIKLEQGKLRIHTSKGLRNSNHNKKLIENWYGKRREHIFKEEYAKALRLFNYKQPPLLRERIMARRWGSYTADNKVSLNPRLIQAPREAIFYVCVHELCHKMSRKHDKAFYAELERRIPNWHRIKESLEIRFG